MRTDPRPDEVRALVAQVLEELDCKLQIADCKWPVEPEGRWETRLDETILIDGGRYVARSYRTDDYLAMWLVDVGIVQFYDADGEMLATVNLFESLQPQKMKIAA